MDKKARDNYKDQKDAGNIPIATDIQADIAYQLTRIADVLWVGRKETEKMLEVPE